MFRTKNRNLLPRRQEKRVAQQSLVSKIQLSRLCSFRKLLIFQHLPRVFKFSLVAFLALYLMGYQPIIGFPPVRKSVVFADTAQNQEISAAALAESFELPHPGYLTTKYSSWHPGIDIATGLGMPVHPVASGKVSEVVLGFLGLGHYTIVEHEQGYKSTYGHMGRVYVKKGDLVTKTSILGTVGMTGHTSGPHTHLELTKNNKYIDPLIILPTVPDWPSWAKAQQAVGGNK